MIVDLRHSIYKRKGRSGWTLEYREEGSVVQRSYPQKGDAEQAWDDLKELRRRGAGLRTAMPVFRDYARRWYDSLRPHLRKGSLLKYAWALDHLDELAATPLDGIDREAVRTLLAAKAGTLSAASSACISSVLRSCLAEAVADGYIRVNPAAGGGSLRRHKEAPRDVKAMDADQLKAFLAACPPFWHAFFYVQWALGLRTGEAMALQPADADYERNRVSIERTCLAHGGVGPTKSASGYVDLSPGAAAILLPRRGRWCFHGRYPHAPLGHSTVEHTFKGIAAAAGLPPHFTPHCLRHTFAAMHLRAGRSIYYVQRMLRHSSIQITVDTYGSWLDPGRPEHVAALESEVFVSSGSVAPLSTAVPSETP